MDTHRERLRSGTPVNLGVLATMALPSLESPVCNGCTLVLHQARRLTHREGDAWFEVPVRGDCSSDRQADLDRLMDAVNARLGEPRWAGVLLPQPDGWSALLHLRAARES